jgi:hypothetical protein
VFSSQAVARANDPVYLPASLHRDEPKEERCLVVGLSIPPALLPDYAACIANGAAADF